MKNGIVDAYTSLDKSIVVDIAIIGAGISGALAAYYLRDSGFSIAVFDRRHPGMGSTAASTAFLQYEIDTPMWQLSERFGEPYAVKCYEVCRKAIYDLQNICKGIHSGLDFHLRPSVQYASYRSHEKALRKEFECRRKNGFDVQWMTARDIRAAFGFSAPGAILSADAGEADAYLLTHALIRSFCDSGHKVFSNTAITGIDYHKRGITLRTADQLTIQAKKLIIACGYESQKYVPKKIADNHSTYALVSEPVAEKYLWHKNCLFWETARPYLYFRIVSGNRILIGGKDDAFYDPQLRDARVKRKARMLEHSFLKKMKRVPLKTDFSWAGAFAVTKDGLPYIGTIPEKPHTYFALGYGGNGITFGVVAAEIIRDMLLKKKNDVAYLFGFDRK